MKTFFRHQLGAIIATGIDFLTMIFLVQILHFSPEWATAFGAFAGGVSNFALGRRWIFKPEGGHQTHAGVQAIRYALVSGGSLVLNATGMHLLATIAGIQYVLARVIVSVLVSVAWNFPMQRGFVFGAKASP